MLAGTQSIVESSNQRHTEDVTRARIQAPHVVAGAHGAPLPAGTVDTIAKLGGVDAVTAVVPTEVYPLAGGLVDQSPWTAVGLSGAGTASTLDPGVVQGSLDDVHGDAVAISRVFADGGALRVGDTVPVRMADTSRVTLRVAAIYDRTAGLGDVLLDPAVARRHAAVPADTTLFVAGGPLGF